LQPDVTLDQAVERIGRIYRPGGKPEPAVALVLGAGNVSSIGPMDVLHKLFAEDRVCVLKMNPVNEHLGPHIAEAFQALVREGFLRVVYGGGAEGAHLTEHPDVAEIHITGSDKTHDVIVFGPGEEGAKRKAADDPKLTKPISSELGNVTPGDRRAGSVVGQRHRLPRGQHRLDAGPERRLQLHRRPRDRHPPLLGPAGGPAERRPRLAAAGREPRALLPGAVDRWAAFTEAHGQSEWFGEEGEGKVPFTLIPELDPGDADDIAFTTEAFCGVMGEVPLDAPRSVVEYIDQAVEFCNEQLWGTLSASIIVHPKSLKDPLVADAVERAIDDLRYGSVVVNHWSAVPYAMVSPSWGAYPGHTRTDIGSGVGVVHNTYLLEDVEKSVCRGPFRMPTKPPWFHTHTQLPALGKALAEFTATRDLRVLPKLLLAASRG
jgi:hypothetical protein